MAIHRDSKAYADGLKDGLEWDLTGYTSILDLSADTTGWDEATIHAMGASACAEAWGVAEEGEAWEQACADYNAGCHKGATAPQDERTGQSPVDARMANSTPKEVITGIDELRRAVRLFDACHETVNQRFTAEELLLLARACRASAWNMCPDQWTERQLQEALRGKVPDWHEVDGKLEPKYEE